MYLVFVQTNKAEERKPHRLKAKHHQHSFCCLSWGSRVSLDDVLLFIYLIFFLLALLVCTNTKYIFIFLNTPLLEAGTCIHQEIGYICLKFSWGAPGFFSDDFNNLLIINIYTVGLGSSWPIFFWFHNNLHKKYILRLLGELKC